jgi:hypothetical protein
MNIGVLNAKKLIKIKNNFICGDYQIFLLFILKDLNLVEVDIQDKN